MRIKTSILLVVLVVSFLAPCFVFKSANAESGLLAYWKFDEGSGTVATDSSGSGNTGTLDGPVWVDGKYGKALEFDGLDDYVEIPFSDSLVLKNWTLMAFCRPYSSQVEWSRLVSVGVQENAINLGVNNRFYTNKPFGEIGDNLGTDHFIFSTIAFQPEAWQMWAFTFNGSTFRLYENGTLAGETAFTGTVKHYSSAVRIGARVLSDEFFKGIIDEVKIYSHALSQQEIRAEAGPIAYWKFDEGSGNIALDSSGHGNNGTLFGATWVNGRFGQAISFDGVDDYVNVTENTDLDPHTRNWTISAWVNITRLSGPGFRMANGEYGCVIVGKRQTVNDRSLTLLVGWGSSPTSQACFGFVYDGSFQLAGARSPSMNVLGWHYVVGVRRGGDLYVYVDGVEYGPNNYFLTGSWLTVGTDVGSSTPIHIAHHGAWQSYYNGTIDDVKIYDRALSQQEILSDMGFVTVSDEFSGEILNPNWVWLDPSADCSHNLTANPGYLRISAHADDHDLYPFSNYNAPRVVQYASGDFVIETRLLFNPQYDAQGAGILMWEDSNNYLRLDRLLHTPGGQVVDLSARKAGTLLSDNQTSYLLTETYLRLERNADRFTAKYSEDGINWITLNSIAFPFNDPVSIGLFVIDQWQNNPVYADFDYFRIGNASQTNKLAVHVVNSNSLPINDALVEASGLSAYSNASGNALFDLPFGTYNVTASHLGYISDSWIVDLNRDENITLTLSYPYVFQGEISNSSIILTPTQGGYNITLLNTLPSSAMDVFFDWEKMGTIAPETWQAFIYDHLPNLVVQAASGGSSGYPKAWYKHPLPIQLTPTTGNEGAIPPEPVPYVAGSIFVIPYPPVYGQNTKIGVTLHNPYNHTMHLSRVDFQISGLTVGGYFESIKYLSNITLQENETRIFSINWIATVGGHHCIRVVLTYSPRTQVIQKNLDVENDVIQGDTGEVSFSLVNPFETAEVLTVKVNKQLSAGSAATLEIDGRLYDTSSDIIINVAPGQELHATLRISTSASSLEDGVVDVEAYVDGQLIGGLRKTIKTVPSYLEIIGWQIMLPPEFVPVPTSCNRYEAQMATDSTNCYTYTFYTPNGVYSGSPLYVIATVKNHGTRNLPIPTLHGSAQGVDAAGTPFPSISGSGSRIDSITNPLTWHYSTSQTIPPDEQTYLAYYVMVPTWTYARSNIKDSITAILIQLGLNAVKDSIPIAQLLYYEVTVADMLCQYQDFVRSVDYALTLIPSGSYSATSSPYMLDVPTPQFKIDALNEMIALKILNIVGTPFLIGGVAVTTLEFTPLVQALIIAALIADKTAITTAAENYLNKQMTDPSINYTSIVPPPTLPNWILSLPNSTASEAISDIYLFNAFMNASVESTVRATGALVANSTYYACVQEDFAVQYARNASVYYSAMTNLTKQILVGLWSQGYVNQTTFQLGQEYISENGLPQQVTDMLEGLDLLQYVNMTELETMQYEPMNDTSIDSLSAIPNAGQFVLINNCLYQGYISALASNETLQHDLAVNNVSPSRNWTYRSRTIDLNATITNRGNIMENGTLTVNYNGALGGGIIGTRTVILAPNEAMTLTFIWDTKNVATYYEGYDITATVSILLGVDNNATNDVFLSQIKVANRIAGDLNGDRIVNIFDVALIGVNWQKTIPPVPMNVDINGDGIINIKDVTLIGVHWQERYPP